MFAMKNIVYLLGLLAFSNCSPARPKAPSADPAGVSLLKSRFLPGATISYKQTTICETTPGVKAYAGYVHLPATAIPDVASYNISTFFWFFESRNDPINDPLAIYLAGGPGDPSLYPAISSESGPCYINAFGNDTIINPYSLNNHVNILYIDQPTSTGYSYSALTNGTVDISTGTINPTETQEEAQSQQNATTFAGIFASQDPSLFLNNTVTSAKAMWHFLQVWLPDAAFYNNHNRKISLWSNSYGGFYGPTYVNYVQSQLDALRANPTKDNFDLRKYSFDTLGITNGCIDGLIQASYYPHYNNNNTYGIQTIPADVYEASIAAFSQPGGCADQVIQCRALAAQLDPDNTANNPDVNAACAAATAFCYQNVLAGPYLAYSNRSAFDIAVTQPDPCRENYDVTLFYNTPSVQADLGVASLGLNFTLTATVPVANFFGTGDPSRRSIRDLQSVLDRGIKVALVYGDRDERCNWLGAEAVSLNATWRHAEQFRSAGYANLSVPGLQYESSTGLGPDVAGVTRQYDSLSFTRIFDAGHSVSAYAPQAVYEVFMRSMFDRDVPTGTEDIRHKGYSSQGPSDSFYIKNVLPESPRGCIVEGRDSGVSFTGIV